MRRIKVMMVDVWATAVCFMVLALKSYRVKIDKLRRLKYRRVFKTSASDFLYTLRPHTPLSNS